jgi:hypothetical protein
MAREKPTFVCHQVSPRGVLYNRRRVYIVAAESVTSRAPRPALINTPSNEDLSKHNHLSFPLLPCGPLSPEDCPQCRVIPPSMCYPINATPRYIFLKPCGCFFDSFAFKCGARYSPTKRIAFCRSPAPKHQVTKVRIKKRCVLHPPPQVVHHPCPQQRTS